MTKKIKIKTISPRSEGYLLNTIDGVKRVKNNCITVSVETARVMCDGVQWDWKNASDRKKYSIVKEREKKENILESDWLPDDEEDEIFDKDDDSEEDEKNKDDDSEEENKDDDLEEDEGKNKDDSIVEGDKLLFLEDALEDIDEMPRKELIEYAKEYNVHYVAIKTDSLREQIEKVIIKEIAELKNGNK